MTRWNVARTWWELTKLVLSGKGGYDMYVRVEELPDEAQKVIDGDNWSPTYLYFTDRRDRFVVLTAEREEES